MKLLITLGIHRDRIMGIFFIFNRCVNLFIEKNNLDKIERTGTWLANSFLLALIG